MFLLTGVTGFLGKVILEDLIRRKDELRIERVGVVIRPLGGRNAADRFRRDVVPARCFGQLEAGWTQSVTVLEGNLEQPGFGLGPEAVDFLRGVTHVVHAAASVKFDLPLAQAARVNVAASLNTLEIARTCPALARFVYVSTAYVTPDPTGGPIEEALVLLPAATELYAACLEGTTPEGELLRRTGHPNSYTLTKTIAENLLVERRGDVPLTIVRPSVITASRVFPFPGWIDSTAGYAAFVMLIGAGHLRALVCRPEAKLDLIPVDEVSQRILRAALNDSGPLTIRQAVAGVSHAPTVAQAWDAIQSFFRIHRVDRRPRGRYLGPRGFRFSIADLLQRRLPIEMARLQSRATKRRAEKRGTRLNYLNEEFTYFTTRTFNFRSSFPLDDSYDSSAFLETVCAGVHRHLFGRDDAKWVLAGRSHRSHGGDLRWAAGQPRGNAWIRTTAWMVTKLFRRIADVVTVDIPSFERALVAVPEGATVVLAPSHRSYLDFVLVAYLAFARPDLVAIPHFAATMDFARIPIVGRVLSAMHAFYLRRGEGKDPELARRVRALLDEGNTLAFFIEGTRSRSGEFLPPKRGLLRCLQGTGRTCVLMPIAISYDRVPEEHAFARELAGNPPARMRLGALTQWVGKAWRGKVNIGRVHVACGTPVVMRDNSDVHAVSHQVIDHLRAAMVNAPGTRPGPASSTGDGWGESPAVRQTEVPEVPEVPAAR